MIRQLLPIVPLLVIIFQNCAQSFNARKESSLSSITSSAFADKEIIIRLKNQTARTRLLSWSASHGMTHEHEWVDISTHHFSWTENAGVNDMMSEVYSLMAEDVAYAEPNYSFKKLDNDDVQIFATGTVTANASSVQTAAPIQFKETWPTLQTSGTKPIVAIIDSGIDFSHSVFTNSNALWKNTQEIPNNGVDDDGNGFVDDIYGWDFANNDNNPSDDQGHGTHVAGIVLGTGQNIFGSTQTPAKIQIMTLKFLTAAGDGKTSDAIQAVYYAVKNGAKVINNSWGGTGYSRTLLDAIAYAYSNKVLFVAAAGNEGKNIDSAPVYPASYMIPNVLPVAATNNSDQIGYSLASKSNESSPSGCGMIVTSRPKPPNGNSLAAVFILLIPFFIALAFRKPKIA